eukprot:11181113-Lingulodinium_polyedra.AAC.1
MAKCVLHVARSGARRAQCSKLLKKCLPIGLRVREELPPAAKCLCLERALALPTVATRAGRGEGPMGRQRG